MGKLHHRIKRQVHLVKTNSGIFQRSGGTLGLQKFQDQGPSQQKSYRQGSFLHGDYLG